MPAGPFVPFAIFIMIILCDINGESIPCFDQEQSPLCFCHSTYRRPMITELFISRVSLSKCTSSYPTRQCRQGLFSPSSTHVSQLVPHLVNHSRCLENVHCLQTLRNTRVCQRCHITPSSLLTENTSYTISTTTNNLPTDSCFYICEHDKSCGFLCFDRRITITIDCDVCRRPRRNVTCRCVKVKQTDVCSQTTTETTTARWMQKRGFPAAGILALLGLVTMLLVIVIKLINYRLDVVARRKSGSMRRSVATITTYRSRQPSPSTAVSFPTTPLISSIRPQRDLITTNTIVGLVNDRSQEFVVDIRRRDDEDELSVFLLEKTGQLNPKSKEMIDADDDDDDDDDDDHDQVGKDHQTRFSQL